MATPQQAQTFIVPPDGPWPNNPRLPVLIDPAAFPPHTPGLATHILRTFNDHDWTNGWIDGLYGYHHYHSTAHEALGVARGTATVRLGGPNGSDVHIAAGYLLVLPAGVTHACRHASADFQIVGAYPNGQTPDMCTDRTDERARAEHRITAVQLPRSDPAHGTRGPLCTLWTNGLDTSVDAPDIPAD